MTKNPSTTWFRNRPDSRSRNLLAALLLAICTFLGLTAWAFASPVGSTPDEDYHLASIWCGQGSRPGLCEVGSGKNDVIVATRLVASSACFAFHPELAACDVPSTPAQTSTIRDNRSGGYPPIFYWVMSAFSSENIGLSVVVMRLINALLFTVLLGVTAVWLPRQSRVVMLGGVAVSLVPLGMFLIPSVNPSSWAVSSACVLWGALVGYFRAESQGRRWALFSVALVATLMGAGARTDSALYSGFAVVLAVILSWEQIRHAPWWRAGLIATLIPIDIVLFFSGGSSDLPSRPGSFNLATLGQDLLQLPSLWLGSLGTWGLGWLDTSMPYSVWATTVFIFAGVIFLGLGKTSAAQRLSIGLVAAALVAIPLFVLVHDNVLVGSYVQPRYTYPLLIMFAGISIWGLGVNARILSRLQIMVIVAGLSIANAIALHTNLRRYITGTDVFGFNLDRKIEWWWNFGFGPMAVWTLGAVSMTAAFVLLGLLIWPKGSDAVTAIASGSPVKQQPTAAYGATAQ